MARRNPLIAALLVTVLVGHGVVLEWVSRQLQAQAALRLMATPMFTRLLQPQAPPAVASAPAIKSAKLRKARSPVAIQSVTPSTPQESTATAVVPEPAAETESAAATPTLAVGPTPPEEAGVAVPPAASASEPAPPAVTASPSTAATATPSVTALDSWPADTRLNYTVGGFFRGELHGNARVQWQRQGERYQTQVDIDLGVVSLIMTSQGVVTPQGLAPSAYEESRAGKRRTALLQETQVVLSDGRQVPRPEGVQDTASQFVELSHRFSSGQLPLEVGRSVSFWMARPGGVDFWTYDVTDKEVLQTPQLGAVEAFHLKPRPTADPRGNVTAEMWFAPSLQYLPVRIRVTSGEAHLDLFVEKIEQR